MFLLGGAISESPNSVATAHLILEGDCTGLLSPSLPTGAIFQAPPARMPETAGSTEPCLYDVFLYTYLTVVKFNLSMRQRERLAITSNKIESL